VEEIDPDTGSVVPTSGAKLEMLAQQFERS